MEKKNLAKSNMEESFDDVLKKPVRLKHSLTSAIELESLGQGAFGRVWKVFDELDEKIYAVKKIQINLDGKNPNEKFQDIRKELAHLSNLTHPNIVRYYNAWIEEPDDPGESESELDSENESSESQTTSKGELDYETGDQSRCVEFSIEDDGEDICNRAEGQQEDICNDSLTCEETDLQYKESREKTPKIYDICIRMEYCSSNLKECIQRELYGDVDTFWRLLKQMLSGLEYIHDQGIIHRDINPSNIFLTDTMCIKIGDFGLATTKTRKSISDSKDVSERAADNSDDICGVQVTREEYSSLTGGVGTKLYAAPETKALKRCTYDQKSDMYSLGLTVFEMSYRSFQTHMEKSKVFEDLSKSILPIDFDESSKLKQVRIIRSLVQKDPSQRPTAKNILDPINDYLPPSLEEEQQFHTKHRSILRDLKSHRRLMLFHDLFNQSENNDLDSLSNELMEQLSGTPVDDDVVQIRDDFTAICRQHGAKEFNLPILLPRSHDFKSSDAVQLLDKTGNILSLTHDPNTSLARYLAHQDVENARLYSICPIYKIKEGKKPQEHRIYTFYHMTLKKNSFQLAELIVMVHQFICKNRSLKDVEWHFVLGNTVLTESFLANFGIKGSKYKRLVRYTTEHRCRLSARMLVCQGLSKQKAREVFRYLGPQVIDSLLEDLGEHFCSSVKLEPSVKELFRTAFTEQKHVLSLAAMMGVDFKMYFAIDLLRCMKYTSGFLFVLSTHAKSAQKRFLDVAHGGVCDNLLLRFKPLPPGTNEKAQMIHSLLGFNVFSDPLLEMSKPESQREKKVQGTMVVAILCKEGGSRKQDKLVTELLKDIWKDNIQVDVYPSTGDPHNADCKIHIQKQIKIGVRYSLRCEILPLITPVLTKKGLSYSTYWMGS